MELEPLICAYLVQSDHYSCDFEPLEITRIDDRGTGFDVEFTNMCCASGHDTVQVTNAELMAFMWGKISG